VTLLRKDGRLEWGRWHRAGYGVLTGWLRDGDGLDCLNACQDALFDKVNGDPIERDDDASNDLTEPVVAKRGLVRSEIDLMGGGSSEMINHDRPDEVVDDVGVERLDWAGGVTVLDGLLADVVAHDLAAGVPGLVVPS
jgi:hypothetical protein